MTNLSTFTTDALGALIAEHENWCGRFHSGDMSFSCTAYLLATEVRDARKVVADVVVTERDAKYAYFVCRLCGGMWRDDEPNGHRENCAVGAYDRVMEEQR